MTKKQQTEQKIKNGIEELRENREMWQKLMDIDFVEDDTRESMIRRLMDANEFRKMLFKNGALAKTTIESAEFVYRLFNIHDDSKQILKQLKKYKATT